MLGFRQLRSTETEIPTVRKLLERPGLRRQSPNLQNYQGTLRFPVKPHLFGADFRPFSTSFGQKWLLLKGPLRVLGGVGEGVRGGKSGHKTWATVMWRAFFSRERRPEFGRKRDLYEPLLRTGFGRSFNYSASIFLCSGRGRVFFFLISDPWSSSWLNSSHRPARGGSCAC